MKGVIARLPGPNTYTLTPDRMRIAVFYTKLHDRLLSPLTAAHRHPRRCRYAKPCTPSTPTSRTT